MSMEAHHKQWNERQTALRELFEKHNLRNAELSNNSAQR